MGTASNNIIRLTDKSQQEYLKDCETSSSQFRRKDRNSLWKCPVHAAIYLQPKMFRIPTTTFKHTGIRFNSMEHRNYGSWHICGNRSSWPWNYQVSVPSKIIFFNYSNVCNTDNLKRRYRKERTTFQPQRFDTDKKLNKTLLVTLRDRRCSQHHS